MAKIYISGKITNGERLEPDFTRFYEAEQFLIEEGWKPEDIFNPARLEEDGASWEHYLARDVKWIMENRPQMWMLPNWMESQGARLEYELATLLELPIIFT